MEETHEPPVPSTVPEIIIAELVRSAAEIPSLADPARVETTNGFTSFIVMGFVAACALVEMSKTTHNAPTTILNFKPIPENDRELLSLHLPPTRSGGPGRICLMPPRSYHLG